jgi:hypothetical protein
MTKRNNTTPCLNERRRGMKEKCGLIEKRLPKKELQLVKRIRR